MCFSFEVLPYLTSPPPYTGPREIAVHRHIYKPTKSNIMGSQEQPRAVKDHGIDTAGGCVGVSV